MHPSINDFLIVFGLISLSLGLYYLFDFPIALASVGALLLIMGLFGRRTP